MNRVKIIRKQKTNLTQEQLAQKLKKQPSSLTRWANQDSQPSIPDLYRVAEILDVDVRELLEPTKANCLIVCFDSKEN